MDAINTPLPSPPSSAATDTHLDTPPPDLDPRIQIELENLNTATDNINRLEIELEEANATFRILLNESTRRLKLLSKKLGTCIDKSRPYHEAADRARVAQIACQAAAVQFQRAHEHYAAAKETVALAEQRFMSGSHEWQFDNAWQEMLNHATIKVAAAEQHKTECNAEHQRKAAVFSAAEVRTSQLEDQLRRNVIKSRPYFEEKQICQDQLQTQKERIQELQAAVAKSKRQYAQALGALEQISEEIHQSRATTTATTATTIEAESAPRGPREPGVGAEKADDEDECGDGALSLTGEMPSLNYARELDRCEVVSVASGTATSSLHGDADNDEEDDCVVGDNDGVASAATKPAATSEDVALEELRQHVKLLAVRPVEGGDGQQTQDAVWETELNATVDRLDRLLMQRESERSEGGVGKLAVQPAFSVMPVSMPSTPLRSAALAAAVAVTSSESPVRHPSPVRQLLKAEPLPAANVSMRELPLLSRLSNELTTTRMSAAAAATAASTTTVPMALTAGGAHQKRRRSLE